MANKSRIEWVKGYSINPVKGLCPVTCDYCYARRMYKRFHWAEKIRWYPPAFDLLDKLTKPSRIFVGSTFELFHESLPYNWMEYNLLTAGKYPQHTFFFLTKRVWNAKQYHFPSNAWLGVSVDTMSRFGDIQLLNEVDISHRFVSFEPLLDFTPPDLRGIDWVIIGQQTPMNEKTKPRMSWVQGILAAASNDNNIPVFMKDNLQPLLTGNWSGWKLRQEFPEVGK